MMCECKGTVCSCQFAKEDPMLRSDDLMQDTANYLLTECNKEGHHVNANICQCKLKQINKLASDFLLTDHDSLIYKIRKLSE